MSRRLGLSREYTYSRVVPLAPEQLTSHGFLLDLRMCQLPSVSFDFHWDIESDQGTIPLQRNEFLGYASQIKCIDVSLNELIELDCLHLRDLREIQILDASLNRIKRVINLDVFTRLTVVNLSHNQLKDLKFVHSVTSLVELNVSMNDIEQITDMPSLVSLTKLNLSDNKLRSLDGIQALPYLKELSVQRNKLESLLPLMSSLRLEYLNASQNNLRLLRETVNVLISLRNLTSIHLLANPIENDRNYQAELLRIKSLTSLDSITLNKNVKTLLTDPLPRMDYSTATDDTRNQMILNHLALKRNQTDDNIRYLQSQIKQQQEEYDEYEAKVRGKLASFQLQHPTLLRPDKDPVDTYRSNYHDFVYQRPLGNNRRFIERYDTEGLREQAQDEAPLTKPFKKGNFKGITDTDEVLRLASAELTREQQHPTLSLP